MESHICQVGLQVVKPGRWYLVLQLRGFWFLNTDGDVFLNLTLKPLSFSVVWFITSNVISVIELILVKTERSMKTRFMEYRRPSSIS